MVWQTKCCGSWFLVLWFGSYVIYDSWFAIRTDSRPFHYDEAIELSLQKNKIKISELNKIDKPMKPQNIINYFKDCFQSDNRELQLLDFFSDRVEEISFVQTKEELLTGDLQEIYVNEDYAKNLQLKKLLYGQEKMIYYAAFFVVSNPELVKQKICTPLLLYPVEILEKENNGVTVYTIAIDTGKPIINFSLFKKIRDSHVDEANFYQKVLEQIPAGNIRAEQLHKISDCLEYWCSSIDTTELFGYPKLMDEKNLRAIRTKKDLWETDKTYRLIPSGGLGVIEKNKQMLGVLAELEELGKNNSLSLPLQHLLTGWKSKDFEAKNKENDPFYKKMFKKASEGVKGEDFIQYTPAILSKAQDKIIYSAQTNDVTLAIGPPGTGKSFSIANIAIDAFARKESVLIVSNNYQAVDVIAYKIENQLGVEGVVIRGGSRDYLSKLKDGVKKIIGGEHIKYIEEKVLNKLSEEVSMTARRLNEASVVFEETVKSEMKSSKRVATVLKKRSFMRDLLGKALISGNASKYPLWDIIDSIDHHLKGRKDTIASFIEFLYHRITLETHILNKEVLSDFLSALTAHSSSIQKERLGRLDFKVLLQLFPIWLVTTSEINSVLPLKKDLFDLVIIDEASQCDIASCLPIIQRAKHVIITGDPKQLRHITFVSNAKMKSFRERHNLEDLPEYDYRTQSILDLATSRIENQDQIIALDEHYRSMPDIISFSNDYFYNKSIKILTHRPNLANKQSLFWVPCGGTRVKQGYNEKEADEVIKRIKQILKSEIAFVQGQCSTIGVLSPFRAQVDYLLKRIQEDFSVDELRKHEVTIGTAHAFQGNEKDTMFLSFAVDNNSHSASLRHISQDEIFNVSITRAKNKQYILTSIDTEKIKAESLFREYLDRINTQTHNEVSTQTNGGDSFLEDVVNLLKTIPDLNVYPAYFIGGMQIDIFLQYKGINVGIDLVGYPSEFKEAFALDQYYMLLRIGIKAVPIPYTLWFSEEAACIDAIGRTLNLSLRRVDDRLVVRF